eukprot:4321655-Lingulodinium_polyedra.AAC.1
MGIGPVVLVPDEDSWKRAVKEHKAIYGKDCRIAPRGRTPNVDAAMAKKMIRKDNDAKPVLFWNSPWQFHEDLT